MIINFSSIGLFTLYVVILWQIQSRVFDIAFAPYFLSGLVCFTLIFRCFINKTLDKRFLIAFTICVLLLLSAAWSIQYSLDTNWSIRSFATYTFRLLVMVLATIIVLDKSAEYIFNKIDILWYPTVIIMILWLTPNFFQYFELTVNFQNAGAAVLVCLLPFLVQQKKYWKSFITTLLILVVGSRMALALVILFYFYLYFFYYLKLKASVVISILIFLGVTIFLILSLDSGVIDTLKAYNPFIKLDIEKGDLDYGRRIHNYHGVMLLKKYWLHGLGIGSFQLYLYELIGREMSPHSFIFFFLLQMGIFSLIVYLILVFISIKPLWRNSSFYSRKLNTEQAIGLSNLLSFGYFFTRPQLDNILYFMIIGAAIGIKSKIKN